MSLLRKLHTFAALPFREKLAFFEAAVLLAYARLLVRFVPLSKWRKEIAVSRRSGDGGAPRMGGQRRDDAKLVRRTIKRVGRNVPVEFVCLPQALTARWMLSRRNVPTELLLGTRFSAEENREFHAWLKAGDFMVTGDCVESEYAILGSQKRG
ncbi:lasso peptide biosynthesis B2 protein [Pontixanthobacter luteolus]|uniref:lasso peptide biosynthesis B2 protein n=1 Tax=Pontixanthobacter luteolus TaxID=295089 RepID=UPI0023046F75|nr:lasso peptide biosynthesis B2 protein [Pontixanthobacter luteolus]